MAAANGEAKCRSDEKGELGFIAVQYSMCSFEVLKTRVHIPILYTIPLQYLSVRVLYMLRKREIFDFWFEIY